MKRVRFAIAVELAVLFAPAGAQAIPTFARRYQTSCHTCHAIAFPELNPFGRKFKENGYQYPEGAEDAYRSSSVIRTGPAERFELLNVPPIAIRGRLGAEGDVDRSSGSATEASFYAPTKLEILGGGSLYDDISVFAAVDLLPTPIVNTLAIGFHNLFTEPGLNIRAGRFTLADFMRPERRAYTLVTNLAEQVRVGPDAFVFDAPNTGVQVWMRPADGPIFLEASTVDSNTDPMALDLAIWKTQFGRVAADLGPHRVSAFGLWGRANITPTIGGAGYADDHSLLGLEGEAALPWGTVYAVALRGHHTNANGDNQPTTYYGTRAEFDYTGTDWYVASLRWDWVWSPDDWTLYRDKVTANITLLAATNVKFIGEISCGLGRDRQMTGMFVAEVAF